MPWANDERRDGSQTLTTLKLTEHGVSYRRLSIERPNLECPACFISYDNSPDSSS